MANLPAIANNGETVSDVLAEQGDTLVRVESVLLQSNNKLQAISEAVSQTLGIQKAQIAALQRQIENQAFADEEARREAARLRAQSVGGGAATATVAGGDGGAGSLGMGGALTGLAGGVAGGLAIGGLAQVAKRFAGRLLKGGGLIAIGSIFGDQIGRSLASATDDVLTSLGADPEFVNQVTSTIEESAGDALIGAGITKMLFGRTLPGIIAGIVFNQLGLDRLFSEEGREDFVQGINDFFNRLRDGELTPEDVKNSAITAAAAAYGTRKAIQVRRSFPSFRPDGTVEGPGQRARPGGTPYTRPRRPNGQFMSDAEIEQEAQRIQNAKLRRAFTKVFRALAVVGVVYTFYDVYRIIDIMNGEGTEDEKMAQIAPILGALIGAGVGGALGAYIGALGGPWGIAIGAGLGAVLGSLGGDQVALFLLQWGLDRSPPTSNVYGGYENMTQEDILRQYAPEALPSEPQAAAPTATATPDATNVRVSTRNATAVPTVSVTGVGDSAREAAERYLGRPMSDEEYNYLLRAVYAESSAATGGDYTVEKAMIMASILNRARSGYADDPRGSVIGALTARNQFQSVTGTANDPGPSPMFNQGPSGGSLADIELAATNILNSVSRTQRDFTAAATGAYGPGTNIGYRDEMLAGGGVTVGGTVFRGGRPGQAEADAAMAALTPAPSNQVSGQVNANSITAESIGLGVMSALTGSNGGTTVINNDNSTNVTGGAGGNGNQQASTIPSALGVGALLQEAFGLSVVNNAG